MLYRFPHRIRESRSLPSCHEGEHGRHHHIFLVLHVILMLNVNVVPVEDGVEGQVLRPWDPDSSGVSPFRAFESMA